MTTAATPPRPTHAPTHGSRLKITTAGIYQGYSAWTPPSPAMGHLGAEYRGIEPAVRALATAIQWMAINTPFWPVNSPVALKIVATHVALVTNARTAEGIYKLFWQVHQHDIMRLEAPRKGQAAESMWNIYLGVRSDGLGISSRPSVLETRCAQLAELYRTKYRPADMYQVYTEVAAISESVDNIAHTVKTLADRSENYPVNKQVVDQIRDTVNRLQLTASEASNLMKLFRTEHAQDLAKHETPRKNEGDWDV